MSGQPVREGVATVFEPRAGVPCVVCRPPSPRGVMVHFHGGGYRLGSARAWLPFGARLASATGVEVIVPDYRLAPEHPFPAALHDAAAILESVADASSLLISGDSAGGGLAMASALLAAGRERPPIGVVLLSPWLDLTVSAETYLSRAATDPLFSLASAREAAETYLQGEPAEHPLASPLLADLGRAPPTLIMASGAEVLLQDSLGLASRLALAGRDVSLHVAPDERHVWPVLTPDRPASEQALRMIGQFVGRLLAGRA